MTQTLLLIVALFTALTITLAFYWNNITTRFVTIALLVILANSVYFSLDGVKGWPAEEKQEVKGTLASVVIINPSDVSDGAIIIGLFPAGAKNWYEYEYPKYAPKTYYIEYSNDRAAEFEKAKEAMMDGREVRINGIPPKNSSDGESVGADSIIEVVGEYIKQFLSSQKDTYKPEVPNIEIMERESPPEKGTAQ